MEFKKGYVGIIGKTNVGKSTLVNALVGRKVAIVSPKKQTTRDNILGILTKDNYQLVFVDTPGLHKSRNLLDKQMMRNVRNATDSVDVIFYVIDASKKVFDDEISYIEHFTNIPVIIGLSKVDLITKRNLLPMISQLSNCKNVKGIIPFSTIQNVNLTDLISEILNQLPAEKEKELFFEEDEYTDKSKEFMIAEIIREKALYLLEEELPYGVAIEITNYVDTEKISKIDVDFICEKDNHKNIVIGKNGSMIKEISTQARLDIEKLLGKKVMLKVWVKVIKNWRQNNKYLFI